MSEKQYILLEFDPDNIDPGQEFSPEDLADQLADFLDRAGFDVGVIYPVSKEDIKSA